jgi:predicted oxidoreductase
MIAFLDAQGIQAVLNNANNTQVDPMLSNALGGVQLFVPNSQAELAIALLRENGFEIGSESTENKLVSWINKLMAGRKK